MITILGRGEQAKAILHYLLTLTDCPITTVDVVAPQDGIEHPRVTHKKIAKVEPDGLDPVAVLTFLKHIEGSRVVINCLPLSYSVFIATLCIEAKAHYIDLGGSLQASQGVAALDTVARTQDVTLIPDAGLAPGLATALVTQLYTAGWTHITIYCGGLPVEPKYPPLHYIKTFHPRGLVTEYLGTAEVIENYQVVQRPTLCADDAEYVEIPRQDVFEARLTSGGLSDAARKLAIRGHQLCNLRYKTLRYPGHYDYVMKNILWRPDAIDVFDKVLPQVNEKHPDIIWLGYKVMDMAGRTERKFWKWGYDTHRKLSAMTQATGYPVGALTKMLLEQRIAACGYYSLTAAKFDELLALSSDAKLSQGWVETAPGLLYLHETSVLHGTGHSTEELTGE